MTKYYLVFNDKYLNGIVLRQDQLKQLKIKSYDLVIECDASMASSVNEALKSLQ